jgi:ABC-type transporter Mla MlaB component
MALEIIQKDDTFELKGKLNTKNSRNFIIHFEYLISTFKNITVNIDKVKAIDITGVEAMKTLIAISLKNHCKFYITGRGCEDIYRHKAFDFSPNTI